METILAFVVGGLYAAGLYMMLRRNIIKLIIGLVLLSQAANLLIFTSSGLLRSNPPIISEGMVVPEIPYADPLPQALILTAIVISFGVLAFAIALIYQVHKQVGTGDLDELKGTYV
ncbi:Na+/H+ antiporter subunit C [candidate division KSB1 bacterium]|nr:Na+/H+ antiporter subunit C [candidate division KSB1 bacterium]